MNLKLNILLILLFINGGSLLALPFNVSGVLTNNGIPAAFKIVYIQANGADTNVVTDSLGEFNFFVNPRNTNGVMRAYFLDCKSDTTDTLVYYNISTRFFQINLNGCSTPQVAKYKGTIKLNGIPIGSNNAVLLRYKYIPNDQKFQFEDTVPIAANASFEFLKDSVSDYLLKVLHVKDTLFAATYYPSGLRWDDQNSKAIGPHLSTSIDINLNPIVQSRGFFSIQGNVKLDSNLIKPGYSAVGIHLLNEQNRAVNFTYTDSLNNFSFQNVDSGTYKIWIDQCGLPTEPIVIQLGRNNPSVTGLVITANEKGVSFDKFVGLVEKSLINKIKIYPNPFSEIIKIELNQASTIMIYDMTGKQIFFDKTYNTEQYEISSSTWKPGLYMVTIKNEDELFRIKMIKK